MHETYNFTELEHYKIQQLKDLVLDLSTNSWELNKEAGYRLIEGLSKLIKAERNQLHCEHCKQKLL